MQPLHAPRHPYAAKEGEGRGRHQKEHSRGVEGKEGQKRLGEYREEGREQQHRQRVATYEERAAAHPFRHPCVGRQQQADDEPGDGDACQRSPVQVRRKAA